MTGSELLTYIKRVFKRTDKDTELYECITDIIVDMRLRMLSDDYSIVSTTLSADTALAEGTYILNAPSDFGHLTIDGVLVRDTTADDVYNPLIKISKAEYDRVYQDSYSSTVSNRNTGIPAHYAYYGRKFYIGPALDHANYEFKINYTTDGVTDITAGTTVVPFTDKYRKVIRDGALMLIFRMLENFDEASIWEQSYEQGLQKIIDNDDYNRSTAGGANVSGIQYNGF